ncbi:hypothetical protein CS390_22945 [Pseudomonas sp. HLS-6]|uniref:DUF4376 domain-containing protein n=1 Tax=Pseudomonas sp. HLS-6 TaxID=2049589 RepID=UPI000C1A5736|nr:hypothetical protein [Pseudomonas sp. HLS-6]ATR85171.1 hypothetical protein CS390_22945 [Pseudomonas sp. HLS-6]
MRYYSPSTGCTYIKEIHGLELPDDAVPIPEERYLSVIAHAGPGQIRGHGLDGLPTLLNIPQPSEAERNEGIHRQQYAAINSACKAAITAGFTSDALGTSHHYTSQLEDQLNLTGVILAGQDTLYACRDESGAKDFRLHTFAQIRQVGDDFTLFKLQLLQKANQLKQQLDQALASEELAALEAVTWEVVQP